MSAGCLRQVKCYQSSGQDTSLLNIVPLHSDVVTSQRFQSAEDIKHVKSHSPQLLDNFYGLPLCSLSLVSQISLEAGTRARHASIVAVSEWRRTQVRSDFFLSLMFSFLNIQGLRLVLLVTTVF